MPAPVSAITRGLPMRRASERLAHGVVHLVRAGVVQVLALEVDLRAAQLLPRGASRGRSGWGGRRSARAHQASSRWNSGSSRHCAYGERRARRAPRAASPRRTRRRTGRNGPARPAAHSRPTQADCPASSRRTLRMNSTIFAGSFTPRLASTPLGDIHGPGPHFADRAPDVLAVRPPERMSGIGRLARDASPNRKSRPVPPGWPGTCASRSSALALGKTIALF